jgi:8-oxo-dGTP pyrophosphatase MutT (NUDIX family)
MLRLRRCAYRIAFRARECSRALRRAPVHSVTGALVCDGRLLLVRHTYGSALWELPGGNVRRGEDPPAALARELGEELGVEVAGASLIETVRAGRRRDRTDLYHVPLDEQRVHPNHAELAELRWCDPAAPATPHSGMVHLAISRLWPEGT